MTTPIINNQSKDDKKKKQIMTARPGGPESDGVAVERKTGRTELSGELLAPLESAKERPEREQTERQIQQQSETQKKQQVRTTPPKEEIAQVFGYKIPPQLASSPAKVSKLRHKGDPNKGITALYIFLDRLFRMKPSTN